MLVLIGKTATGKDSIKKELLKLGMDSVVTTTTRPMREGEIKDVTYHFIDKSQFRRLKIQGFFAETTSYDTVHGIWHYGTQYKDLENNNNKVIILNPYGIKTFADKLDISKWLIVHVTCPEKTLLERLKSRGDDPKESERRLEADRKDFANIERFVDIELLNDGAKTPEEMARMIKNLYDRHMREN